MRVLMLGLGLVGIVSGCGPASVTTEDKQLWVGISSVQLPASGTLPAQDLVTVRAQLAIKDCPPVGTLQAFANGQRLVTNRGGLTEHPRSPLSFGVGPLPPTCEMWDFERVMPRALLGAERSILFEVRGDGALVAAATIEGAFRPVATTGTSVNQEFALRFEPRPPADLDTSGCHAETVGDTMKLHCGASLQAGQRQLVSFGWTEAAKMTCIDAVCPATVKASHVQGFTYSCTGAGPTLDCRWD
jgi:hypothetical protein